MALYLQVCKQRAIFQLSCCPKNCQIHYAYTKMLKYFVFKSENKQEHFELTIIVALSDVKHSPGFTDL